MKRSRKVYPTKPSEQDFIKIRTRPLPAWMKDPKLLPKDPPNRRAERKGGP